MNNFLLFRKALALLLWTVALVSLSWYMRISIRLWLDAVRRREPSLFGKERLSFVAGVSVTLGVGLAALGVVLWFPELQPLLHYGLGIAVILGISAAINIKIRYHYGKRLARKGGEESTQANTTSSGRF